MPCQRWGRSDTPTLLVTNRILPIQALRLMATPARLPEDREILHYTRGMCERMRIPRSYRLSRGGVESTGGRGGLHPLGIGYKNWELKGRCHGALVSAYKS